MLCYALVAQYFLHPFDNLRRSIEDFFDQRFEFFAGCWLHVHPSLLCFGKDVRVIQSFHKGVSQELHSVRRSAGSHHHRPAKIPRGQHNLGYAAASGGGL